MTVMMMIMILSKRLIKLLNSTMCNDIHLTTHLSLLLDL